MWVEVKSMLETQAWRRTICLEYKNNTMLSMLLHLLSEIINNQHFALHCQPTSDIFYRDRRSGLVALLALGFFFYFSTLYIPIRSGIHNNSKIFGDILHSPLPTFALCFKGEKLDHMVCAAWNLTIVYIFNDYPL